MKGKRGIGKKYEEKICQYLIQKKYTLIEKNFRFKHFEIDIIAVKEKIILFAEVKYRKNKKNFITYPPISQKQQKNIRSCAEAFISMHPEHDHCLGRFDIFLLTPSRYSESAESNEKGENIDIQHFKNIF